MLQLQLSNLLLHFSNQVRLRQLHLLNVVEQRILLLFKRFNLFAQISLHLLALIHCLLSTTLRIVQVLLPQRQLPLDLLPIALA